MFKLLLQFKDMTLQEYPLQDGDVLTVGSDPTNDIVIEVPPVSSKHAYIARMGEELILWGRGSNNGTLLNDMPVESAELSDGDCIEFGSRHCLKVSIPIT